MNQVPPLLDVQSLGAGYSGRPVLHAVSVRVRAGETVAVLGPNGAGKTTLLRALLGLLPAVGAVRVGGVDVTMMATEHRVRLGIGYVPEGRRLFSGMSVEDNLLVSCRANGTATRRRLDWIYDLFPQLPNRRFERAWRLSGGQQQMVAIGRALMGDPVLLLLDEPVSGLAPALVAAMEEALRDVAAAGVGVLLTDSVVARGLDMGGHYHVLLDGRFVAEGATGSADGAAIEQAYFGARLAPGGTGS